MIEPFGDLKKALHQMHSPRKSTHSV